MLPRSAFALFYYLSKYESLNPSLKRTKLVLSSKLLGLTLATTFLALAPLIFIYISQFLAALLSLSSLIIILSCLPLKSKITYCQKLLNNFPYAKHSKFMSIESHKSWKPQLNLAFITIFNPPDLIEFENNLKNIRDCFIDSKTRFKILAVVDGSGAYCNSNLAIEIAKKYFDIVASGNFQRKRENLRWMINQSWDMGFINQLNKENVIMHFIDDDTIPGNIDLVNNLTKNFANIRIGGVTTQQYVYKPKYFWQHVMQIFESARNYGSQACLSLFGSVGCMPGRWYCVRGSIITKYFSAKLATEYISLFGLFKRIRDPGDDRLITIEVQMNDYLTIMESNAVVYTETPRKFKQLWGMVTRWARSSNIYTIQYTLCMIKKPNCIPTLILYWSNIIMAFWTIYIAGPYFIYSLLFGSKSISLHIALLISLVGMFLTMSIRQIPLIINQPRYFKWMAILGFLGIFMQFVQVYGMFTFLRSKWTGVRSMGMGDQSKIFTIEKIA